MKALQRFFNPGKEENTSPNDILVILVGIGLVCIYFFSQAVYSYVKYNGI